MTSQPILIKIEIAERAYPLQVAPEEEAIVREASRLLNEQLSAHYERFRIEDRQDRLAMVAFDMIVERLLQQQQQHREQLMVAQELRRLDGVLTATLKS
jgi:cell division protein ZapA